MTALKITGAAAAVAFPALLVTSSELPEGFCSIRAVMGTIRLWGRKIRAGRDMGLGLVRGCLPPLAGSALLPLLQERKVPCPSKEICTLLSQVLLHVILLHCPLV